MNTKKSYIPDWLEQHKSKWLSAGVMSKLFDFKYGDKVIKVSSAIAKFPMPYKQSIYNGIPSKLYQVKEVIAKMKAHGITPIEIEIPEEVKPYIPQIDNTTGLKNQIVVFKTAYEDLKKELHRKDSDIYMLRQLVTLMLSATDVKDAPGVYFFCNAKDIVYVGMSQTSVLKRVQGRSNLVEKTYMIETSKDDAPNLERLLIGILQPSGNTSLNPQARKVA